jgi:hypothetical protein
MKNFNLKIFAVSIILIIPYSSFAQKQLVRSVYKGAKGLFRAEAKVLTKEGIKATNKEMLEGTFKSGAKESVRTMSRMLQLNSLLEVRYARIY